MAREKRSRREYRRRPEDMERNNSRYDRFSRRSEDDRINNNSQYQSLKITTKQKVSTVYHSIQPPSNIHQSIEPPSTIYQSIKKETIKQEPIRQEPIRQKPIRQEPIRQEPTNQKQPTVHQPMTQIYNDMKNQRQNELNIKRTEEKKKSNEHPLILIDMEQQPTTQQITLPIKLPIKKEPTIQEPIAQQKELTIYQPEKQQQPTIKKPIARKQLQQPQSTIEIDHNNIHSMTTYIEWHTKWDAYYNQKLNQLTDEKERLEKKVVTLTNELNEYRMLDRHTGTPSYSSPFVGSYYR